MGDALFVSVKYWCWNIVPLAKVVWSVSVLLWCTWCSAPLWFQRSPESYETSPLLLVALFEKITAKLSNPYLAARQKLNFMCSPGEAHKMCDRARTFTCTLWASRHAACTRLLPGWTRACFAFDPPLANHEFSLVGNTSLKKVLVCVCSCCSLCTLFCGPRYWRLLLFVPFFFSFVHLTFPIWCVCCYQFLLLHPLPLCLSWLHRYLSQASWPGCRKTVSLDKLSC